MVKLDKHLKFFVRTQMANDPSWRNLKVVYSGCDVPGEGEHKIMEYIRYQVLTQGGLFAARYKSRKYPDRVICISPSPNPMSYIGLVQSKSVHIPCECSQEFSGCRKCKGLAQIPI